MAYVVYTSYGSLITAIPTGTVDSSATSLSLIGRDVTGYGQYYNQNLVSMLTNFSNSSAPSNPLQGQLWYDNYYNKLLCNITTYIIITCYKILNLSYNIL